MAKKKASAKPKTKTATAPTPKKAASKTSATAATASTPKKAPAPAAKAAAKLTGSPSPAPTLPAVQGSQEAYNAFLAAAQALTGALVPFRADGVLAYHNLTTGLDAITAQKERIAAELPTVDLARLQGLPKLALGLLFAVEQVDRGAGSGAIRAQLTQAAEVRDVLLTSAEALAKSKIIPEREVEKIRAGSGPIDLATDCVMLSALFQKYKVAVAGKTAVTDAQVTEAGQVGSQLLTLLHSKRSHKAQAKEVQEAADLRDRFWTMLVTQHQELRRVGFWIFGEQAFNEKVPALQSRVAPPKKKASKPKQ